MTSSLFTLLSSITKPSFISSKQSYIETNSYDKGCGAQSVECLTLDQQITVYSSAEKNHFATILSEYFTYCFRLLQVSVLQPKSAATGTGILCSAYRRDNVTTLEYIGYTKQLSTSSTLYSTLTNAVGLDQEVAKQQRVCHVRHHTIMQHGENLVIQTARQLKNRSEITSSLLNFIINTGRMP